MNALKGRTDLRAWRQNVGLFQTLDGKRRVYCGVPGAADISGILADGRRLEIETKTHRPGSEQFEQQRIYEKMILDFGGVYILARSVDDLIAVIGPRTSSNSIAKYIGQK